MVKESFLWDKFDVDETFAKLAAREFADPKHGMPEWVKNSSDAYIREGVSRDERLVVLFYQSSGKGRDGEAFACLDLVGMTTDSLLKFRRWGDPTAAGQGKDIAGGHGNGGKSFAIAGFSGSTLFYTCRNGVGNVYGFPEPPRPVTAWISDGQEFSVSDTLSFLDESLSKIGLHISDLATPIRDRLAHINGFTFVVGRLPKDVSKRFIENWATALKNHKEMVIPLRVCDVYVVIDGTILNNGKPLVLDPIVPMSGYEEPRVIHVPKKLSDPETEKEVSTVDGGLLQGELTLCTMEKRVANRHRIDYIQGDRIVGTRPVREFVGQGYWTDSIYGSCTLPALTEEYVGNLRGPLVDRPLTRALNTWIGDQILAWADEMLKRALKDKAVEVTEQRKKRIIEQMRTLNELKDKLLDEVLSGAGTEEEGGGGPKKRKPKEMLPELPVAAIRIASAGETAGVLVELPLTLVFYAEDGTEVRPIPVTWHSSDSQVARVNPDREVIATDHEGYAEIWCQAASGVVSNRIPLRVVDCTEIILIPSKLEVSIGRRKKVRAIGILHDGEEVLDVRLWWRSSDEEIVIVGQHGLVTGVAEGEAIITALEGDFTSANIQVNVKLEVGGRKGPGKPQFLMSEIQTAWYMSEPKRLTADQRLVDQDATDATYNVWWINLKSPMAEYIYNKHGETSEVWLVYLAERFADGVAEAALVSGPERGQEMKEVSEVVWNVALSRKDFIKRFINEYHKGGQLVVLDE